MVLTGERYTEARLAILDEHVRELASHGPLRFSEVVGLAMRRARQRKCLTLSEAAAGAEIPRLKWDLLERGGCVQLTAQQRDAIVQTVSLDACSAHALRTFVTAGDRVDDELDALTRRGLAVVADGSRNPIMTSAIWNRSILVAEMDHAPWLAALPGEVELATAGASRVANGRLLAGGERRKAVEVLEAAHPPPGDWIDAAVIVQLGAVRLTGRR